MNPLIKQFLSFVSDTQEIPKCIYLGTYRIAKSAIILHLMFNDAYFGKYFPSINDVNREVYHPVMNSLFMREELGRKLSESNK